MQRTEDYPDDAQRVCTRTRMARLRDGERWIASRRRLTRVRDPLKNGAIS